MHEIWDIVSTVSPSLGTDRVGLGSVASLIRGDSSSPALTTPLLDSYLDSYLDYLRLEKTIAPHGFLGLASEPGLHCSPDGCHKNASNMFILSR